jgi:hypothetical protein
MKKSLLALAVSLAAASGANAAWNTGNDPLLIDGNGELVLLAFDPVTQNSYTQDLGITFNQLRAGYAGSINLDPAHIAIFGGNYSNVQYTVLAGSNTQYNADYSDFNYSERGFIYSLNPGQAVWETNAANNDNAIAGQLPFLDLIGSATGLNTSPAANPGYSVAAGGLGYAGSDLNGVGYFEGALGRDLSGSNGSAVEMWLKGYTQDDGFGDPLNLLLGTATLNLAGGNGSISFASSAPEVPVPAAVWLLGSALVGLGGVARRRRV